MKIWKDLIYQGSNYGEYFEVSSEGDIRNKHTLTIYKIQHTSKGYCIVCLTMGSRKKRKTFRIHKAVAETFIANPYNKPQVNHIDGNKDNNYVTNLEWVTNSENMEHALNNNLLKQFDKGTANINAKLDFNIVNYIRKNFIYGDKQFGYKPLARKFNVSRNVIRDIVKGVTWV